MRKLYVPLSERDIERLDEMARHEMRSTAGEQAAWLLKEAIERQARRRAKWPRAAEAQR